MFGPGKESMADYLTSCNLKGQPTRRKDDTCIMDSSSTLGGNICNMASYCPQGCVDCTSSDKCNGYVETGCSMTDPGTAQSEAAPTFEGCQAFAVTNGDNIDNIVTFFTFASREEECRTYPTGKRSCAYKVARQTMSMDDITDCQTNA